MRPAVRAWLGRLPVTGPVVATGLVVSLLAPWSPGAATDPDASRSLSSTVRTLEHRVAHMSKDVAEMERMAARYRIWAHCVSLVPADEAGDPDHRFGFLYDELDGTGLDHRPAIVLHQGDGWSDFALLSFERRPKCVSAPVDPNGTGDDARTTPGDTARGDLWTRVRHLERKIKAVNRRLAAVIRMSERFDEWESCLSWLPVTETGDLDHRFGHLFRGSDGMGYHAALGVDGSEWDDPDYELLAFLDRDRPFVPRECQNEPGEDVDRTGATPAVEGLADAYRGGDLADAVDDLAEDTHAIREEVEDLWEPVEEFTQFDECMFLLGATNLGTTRGTGFVYQDRHHARSLRPALTFGLSGPRPQLDLMAFPGEEPPQIECNEDAGGHDTDE